MSMNIDTDAKHTASANPAQTSNAARAGAVPNGQRIGGILAATGKLRPQDVELVMELQRREGWRFGEAAVRLRLLSERELLNALHKQYDLPHFQIERGAYNEALVTALQPYHPRSEELRSLRTQLLIRWYKRSHPTNRILAVASPDVGDGRSYVAANLAVLFAQLGERTLLIDADMRKPQQHRFFNASDRIGLSAVLSGRAGADAAHVVPGLPRLHLLSAGAPPPNPLELLSRSELGALLDRCRHEFDVVIVDTPPALSCSDVHAIGFAAGNAIVLARQEHTRIADATQVVRDLRNGGTHVVGTVINRY